MHLGLGTVTAVAGNRYDGCCNRRHRILPYRLHRRRRRPGSGHHGSHRSCAVAGYP